MDDSKACNCFICAKEFECEELKNLAFSSVNVTRFKICQGCIDACDPADDYAEAKKVIGSWLWFNEARSALQEAKDILDDVKKHEK